MRGSNLDSARSIKMKENSILFRIQEAEERRLRLYEDYKAEILDEEEYSQLKEHYIAEKQRLEHELQKQRQRALELEKRIKICDAQMERMRGIRYINIGGGLAFSGGPGCMLLHQFPRPDFVTVTGIKIKLTAYSGFNTAAERFHNLTGINRLNGKLFRGLAVDTDGLFQTDTVEHDIVIVKFRPRSILRGKLANFMLNANYLIQHFSALFPLDLFYCVASSLYLYFSCKSSVFGALRLL